MMLGWFFDEFHERSAALDLGLAILVEKRRQADPTGGDVSHDGAGACDRLFGWLSVH